MPAHSLSRVSKAIFLVLLVACLVLLVATALLTPVSNDAGAYLTQADGILAGRLPYRDTFDHKTPGTYVLFAAILAATGRSLAAVQLVQALGVVVTAALTALLAWRLWNALAGALAGLLLLYGGSAYAGTHLTTEAWVGLCTAGALLVLLRRPNARLTNVDWLAAGGLVGLSALFKQTGILTLAAFALWAWLTAPGWKVVIHRWLWLLAGCALPLALTAGIFASQGALPDLWRDTVWVNATAYPRQSLSVLVRGNLINLRAFPVLAVGLLTGVLFHPPSLRRQGPRQAETLLWLTLVSGLLPLLHRSYGHYVLQPLPPAAILAGAGLATAWQRLVSRPRWVRTHRPDGIGGARFGRCASLAGLPDLYETIGRATAAGCRRHPEPDRTGRTHPGRQRRAAVLFSEPPAAGHTLALSVSGELQPGTRGNADRTHRQPFRQSDCRRRWQSCAMAWTSASCRRSRLQPPAACRR